MNQIEIEWKSNLSEYLSNNEGLNCIRVDSALWIIPSSLIATSAKLCNFNKSLVNLRETSCSLWWKCCNHSSKILGVVVILFLYTGDWLMSFIWEHCSTWTTNDFLMFESKLNSISRASGACFEKRCIVHLNMSSRGCFGLSRRANG